MANPTENPPSRDLVVRSNEAFGRLAGLCFDYRWVVLALGIALVGASLWIAGQARIDNSYEAYFDPQDPAYLAYERFREDFGSDEVSYILYSAPGVEHGPWNLEVMRKIAEITEAIEDEVPFVYEVTTLANAELVRGAEDGIEIQKITDDFPSTQEELLALRDAYLEKHMLVGGIVSADAQYGAIVVEMDRSSTDPPDAIRVDPEKGDELDNLYPQATDDAIEAILARPEYAEIDFDHSGDVPLNSIYNRIIANESGKLDLITACVIATILLLTFRSVLAALAPIAVLQASIFACVALITLVGWKLDMSFGSTPTLLTAIGVAHAVHILSEFRARLQRLGDRREALVRTLYLVGTPCLMTSLTTAVGFLAMSSAPIKSISHSGVYNAFGVIAAFALSLTLLMSLLSMGRKELAGIAAVLGAAVGFMLLGGQGVVLASVGALAAGAASAGLVLALFERRPRAQTSAKGGALAMRALAAVAAFDIRHRRAILAAFGLVALASLAGMSQLVVDTNWLDDFSDRVELKAITERVDRVMGGTTNIIYLFDSGAPDGIKDPAVLREMERLQEIGGEQSELVRKSYSLVDILKDLNQAFHGGDPAYYRIPETRELVAQYLLLYELSGGEEAEEYVSSDYRRASVEFRLALAPVSETAKLVAALDAELATKPLEATTVELTGIGALWLKLLDYIVSSQVQGFGTAFVVIALMMVLIFRSLRLGMISMVPNVAPVIFTLGVMGVAGIPLDYSKVMIAAVAIGIAVDDTIHLVLRYRHEFLQSGSYAQALTDAMQDVGRALVLTSVALVAGFLVLVFSVLASQAMYGILLATTIAAALVADFLLLPALVLTFEPFGPEGARARDERSSEADLREAA